MRELIRWPSLVLVLAVALTAAPSVLAQQQVTTTHGPFALTSTSGTQLSNVVYTVNVNTLGVLQVEYTTLGTHCSDVRMHFLVDGVERALSNFIPAGTSTGFFNVGPVTPGAHTVALQAEGRVGGCNTGQLSGWGGTTSITVTAAAAAPAAEIPGPGLIATLIAFAIGVFAFGPWRRR